MNKSYGGCCDNGDNKVSQKDWGIFWDAQLPKAILVKLKSSDDEGLGFHRGMSALFNRVDTFCGNGCCCDDDGDALEFGGNSNKTSNVRLIPSSARIMRITTVARQG